MMTFHISTMQGCRLIPCLSSSLRHFSISSALTVKSPTEIPKKPNTPWVNFYVKNLPTFKKSYPDLPTTEVMRKVSHEWAKVPEQDKSKLKTLFQKEKETYAAKMAKVPEELIENVKAVKKTKKIERQNTQEKKELKDLLASLNKPKRPLSAYLLFCQDIRPRLTADGLVGTEIVRKMAVEWKQANTRNKELFEKKNEELVSKYVKELERWSKKMHEEGRNEEIVMAQSKVAKMRKTADEGKNAEIAKAPSKDTKTAIKVVKMRKSV
eukprot:GFUD01093500.1.p1 GENE.GFUD01093500.1~~GFUD01093500.1.p1  ORF type:complete len:267 (+),score=84.77 GFUD01093500.1:81-881(+)